MKKRIHINQHVIRANAKNGTNDPAIHCENISKQLLRASGGNRRRVVCCIFSGQAAFTAGRVYGWKLTIR